MYDYCDLLLLKKIFGNIVPEDSKFNKYIFLRAFKDFILKPLTGIQVFYDEKDVQKKYTKYKNVLKYLSCTIEHDEFHKIYNCVIKFTKYNTTYQTLELNLRYDKSHIFNFYYHANMKKYIQSGEQVSLVFLHLIDRKHCHIISEYLDSSYYAVADSTYFVVDGDWYEEKLHNEFNDSSMTSMFTYDKKLNLKRMDYFCVGDYNFSISLESGLYIAKRYNFTSGEKDLSDSVATYLNHSGFNLVDLTQEDLLMCAAYAC